MGYGQIWEIKSRRKWLTAWPKLVADTQIIVDAADIDLTSERVWDLIEVQHEYGGSEEAVKKLLDPPPPIVDEEDGIIFNGIQNDGCEPMVLERCPDELKGGCKTNRREYDTVVCAVLTRAKQLLGSSFYAGVPSIAAAEDEDDGWDRAFSLIRLLWPEEGILTDEESEQHEWDSDKEEIETGKLEPRGSDVVENLTEPETMQRHLLPLEMSDNLVDKFLQWIRNCDAAGTSHDTCSNTGRRRHLPLLRLIDIERGCIVHAPHSPSYAALSYVWGNTQQTRLLSSNIPQLTEGDGLYKHGISISKTIADSMALCQRLGYRYLWVDALCILQDNSHDKVLQLNTMRGVYSNAALTIVAAEGNHADSGLNQVDKSTASEGPDIWKSFAQSLSKTVWDTRGWTFQEKVLSRRLLLFSPDGPFFVCGAQISSEHGSQHLNAHPPEPGRPGSFFNISSGIQLESYLAAVQHYSTRELSMESDFENAIKGILKTFGHSMDEKPNTFFQGIPTAFFDDIFCWRGAEHDPAARRTGFPSWSWHGWKQTPLFPDMIMDRINWKQSTNRWGSRILADDRCNFNPITKLDPAGRSTAGPNPLMMVWHGAPLEISMECSEDVGATNGLFRVFSQANHQSAGLIQLHKEWRAKQPATMEFLPVFNEMKNREARIKVLMCLERSEQPSRGGAPPWASFERVQLMDCDIKEQEWMGMIEGSPASKGREISWIY